MSYDEVVFRRSYLNLILLNRAIPGFKPFDEDKDDESVLDIEHVSTRQQKPSKDAMHASNFFLNFM